MAELDNDKMGEDYLESLLDSVSGNDSKEEYNTDDSLNLDNMDAGNEEATGTDDKYNFDDDEDDIEQLLNMLDKEGMDEDLNSDEVDKVVDELDNKEELKNVESLADDKGKKEKKKDKKRKLFGKNKDEAKDETENSDSETEGIQPDDNEKIIKSVEDSLGDAFDLSDLEGFGDDVLDELDSLEDRSSKPKEKSDEEIKAEKKAEKEKKKKEKEEKKAAKKKEKEEKKAAAKAKKAEKKKEKTKQKESVPVEKVKIPAKVVILGVTLVAAVTVGSTLGGKFIWYKNHIDDATELLLNRKYSEAYESISGLKVNKSDEGLYNQLKTLMYIEREYDAYTNCTSIGMEREALNALFKGIEKYDVYEKKAEEYGVGEQAKEIYDKILTVLKDDYNLTEEEARNIENISDAQEYSEKIDELVNNSTDR